MESKEKILERFMRDQEHKASSLYDSGYREGYEEGHNVGYVKGFDAGRIVGNTEGWNDCEEYGKKPEKDAIKVGDEVIDPNGLRAIVTNTDTHYHLLYPSNGKTWKAPKSTWLKKTGAEFTL